MALDNDAPTYSDLMALPHVSHPTAPAKQPQSTVISIPTSLSGVKYSNFTGVTHDSDGQKFQSSTPLP